MLADDLQGYAPALLYSPARHVKAVEAGLVGMLLWCVGYVRIPAFTKRTAYVPKLQTGSPKLFRVAEIGIRRTLVLR